jgi:hypothetical protein
MSGPTGSQPPLEVSVANTYRDLAIEFRRENGFGDPADDQDPSTVRFHSQVKGYFQEAVVRIYWSRLRHYLRKVGIRDSGKNSIEEILGVNRGQISRWNQFERFVSAPPTDAAKVEGFVGGASTDAARGDMPPLKHFLVLLASPGIAVEDVGFPGGWQASRFGIVGALVRIRNELLGLEPLCLPDSPGGRYTLRHVDFTWLYYQLLTPDWPLPRPESLPPRRPVLDRIAAQVAQHFPKERPLTDAAARRLMLLWTLPWSLFESVNSSELLVGGFSLEED